MIDEPKIKQTEAQLTAVIQLTIPREEIREVIGPSLDELMSAIAAQGIKPTGPWFTHHLKMDPDIFNVEVSVPIGASLTAVGRVQPSQLPAATVAQTNYHGPYEGLGDAWSELVDWITAQGYTPAPDLWERYLIGPTLSSDPATWRTELNRPVIIHTSRT